MGIKYSSKTKRVAILAFDGSTEMSISMSRDLFYAGAVAQQGELSEKTSTPETWSRLSVKTVNR